ncbi:MAG: carbohydrate-binding family 9-like protein [Balneolaceae bacterium]
MENKINLFLYAFFLFPVMIGLSGCTDPVEDGDEQSVYTVTRLDQPVDINAEWDKEPWNSIPSLHLGNHMGEEPEPRPDVHVKVAYDDEAVYVIFHVQDQYVRCVVDEYQGPVSRDSCVEFFFTPGTDISEGYFNLETNCGGTALFAFQEERGVGRINIPESEFENVDLAHSMPSIVDPEITDPVTWTIEYRLPVDILNQYTDVAKPASGVEWKANFYKIASQTSHPHYLTWSHVDNPEPQFHLPEYFGTIVFE